MPENPHSPHGNYNPLERVIKAASNESNYSWCEGRCAACIEMFHPANASGICMPPLGFSRGMLASLRDLCVLQVHLLGGDLH